MALPYSPDKIYLDGDVLTAATVNSLQEATAERQHGFVWHTFGLARAEITAGTATRNAAINNWTINVNGQISLEIPMDIGYLMNAFRVRADGSAGAANVTVRLSTAADGVKSAPIASTSFSGGGFQFMTIDLAALPVGAQRLPSPQSIWVVDIFVTGAATTASLVQVLASRDQNPLS